MDLVTGSLTLWADLLQASATPGPHAYLLPHYLAARRLFTLHPSTSGYLLSKAPALGYSDLPASVQFPTALKDLSCLCLSYLSWEVESAPASAQSALSCYTQVTGGCCRHCFLCFLHARLQATKGFPSGAPGGMEALCKGSPGGSGTSVTAPPAKDSPGSSEESKCGWTGVNGGWGREKGRWGHGGDSGSLLGFPVAQTVKNPPAVQETWVWPLGWEDPLGEGNSYPLQYSCLENSMDRGAWKATGVTNSWTQLSDFHYSGGSGASWNQMQNVCTF